jgi:hypothetical protein
VSWSPPSSTTMKNWLPPESGAPVFAMATVPSGYGSAPSGSSSGIV